MELQIKKLHQYTIVRREGEGPAGKRGKCAGDARGGGRIRRRRNAGGSFSAEAKRTTILARAKRTDKPGQGERRIAEEYSPALEAEIVKRRMGVARHVV